jgi:hypothetical protein
MILVPTFFLRWRRQLDVINTSCTLRHYHKAPDVDYSPHLRLAHGAPRTDAICRKRQAAGDLRSLAERAHDRHSQWSAQTTFECYYFVDIFAMQANKNSPLDPPAALYTP